MSFGFGQGQDVLGCASQNLLGDLVDVSTRVTVFWRGLFARGREQRACETVDLGTVIVEVVLASNLCALRLQHAGEGIADRCPAGSADVNRAGRVCRYELEIHLEPL